MDHIMEQPQHIITEHGNSIRLSLPSVLGNEKLVWQTIAWAAPHLDLPPSQIADLQTAACEACINAIEHGNQAQPELRVEVLMLNAAPYIEAYVCDQGVKRFCPSQKPTATIEDKLGGLAPARGMGLLLIEQLVDEAEFVQHAAHTGNCFRLRIYRPGMPTGDCAATYG